MSFVTGSHEREDAEDGGLAGISHERPAPSRTLTALGRQVFIRVLLVWVVLNGVLVVVAAAFNRTWVSGILVGCALALVPALHVPTLFIVSNNRSAAIVFVIALVGYSMLVSYLMLVLMVAHALPGVALPALGVSIGVHVVGATVVQALTLMRARIPVYDVPLP